jgi:AcrR family transcriptional regulator
MPKRSTQARPRAQLTPDMIIEVAGRIAATSGADGLTVRRLGQDLGADPTAIYRHFRDKDEILLEVADRLLQDIVGHLPDDLAWRARLEWLARHTVATLLAHPPIGVAMASRTTRRAGEFKAVDVILGALREAGLCDEDAVIYYRTFADTILSYAGMTASYAMLDESARHGDESAWSREYLMASPTQYPNIAAVAPLLAKVTEDAVLTTLIQLLVDGVERKAGSARPVNDHNGRAGTRHRPDP